VCVRLLCTCGSVKEAEAAPLLPCVSFPAETPTAKPLHKSLQHSKPVTGLSPPAFVFAASAAALAQLRKQWAVVTTFAQKQQQRVDAWTTWQLFKMALTSRYALCAVLLSVALAALQVTLQTLPLAYVLVGLFVLALAAAASEAWRRGTSRAAFHSADHRMPALPVAQPADSDLHDPESDAESYPEHEPVPVLPCAPASVCAHVRICVVALAPEDLCLVGRTLRALWAQGLTAEDCCGLSTQQLAAHLEGSDHAVYFLRAGCWLAHSGTPRLENACLCTRVE
jgi:hypothetical protein